MADEREILTWDLFGTASRELAQQVADDGFQPDIILAIARGGLLIAGALGYALSIKNLYTMNVEYYTGVDERLEVPMILPPTPELVEVEQAHVLIADDVADTGHTLALVKEFCTGQGGGGPLRRAVREAPVGGAVRVRVAPDRPVDQLPVERPGPDRGPPGAGRRQGRLSRSRARSTDAAGRAAGHRERMTAAALRPLAPHTPAPGKVAAPVR